jgi:RNA polymerase sigma-70 factor (ECF subfamily)
MSATDKSSELGSDTKARASEGSIFVTTHWSVVVAAQDKTCAASAEALEDLCGIYWYPLYAFVRRLGHGPQDAEDLTQEFFARLLHKGYLQAADPEKGRFRTFLRVAIKRFLANEWDRVRAEKRGGGRRVVTLDAGLAERLFSNDPGGGLSLESAYDKRWALALVDQSLRRLRSEYEQQGKKAEFEALKPCLDAARGAIDYGELAAGLAIAESTARVLVHRLRRRFRDIFREEVAQTLADPGELDEEMRHLVAALAG